MRGGRVAINAIKFEGICLKNEYHGNALRAFVYVYIREISVSRAHSLYNFFTISLQFA
jgi:hypothetical protein